MDYDATTLPAAYDRGRRYPPEVLELWLNTLSSYLDAHVTDTILDLGCGTGRFSEALADRFDASVTAVDPSKKMLRQARQKRRDRRVRYKLGRGEAIPLPDASVDLIFMSMVFHHFESPTLVARECRRVLRTGKTAFLRTGTRERSLSYPFVDFFPASRTILQERLPEHSSVRQAFESAGFETVDFGVVTQQIAPSYLAYAEKLAAGADSVLASLSQRDFDAGLQALRTYAMCGHSGAVFDQIDIFVFR